MTELAQTKKELRDLQHKINDARGVSIAQIETRAQLDPALVKLAKRRGEVLETIAEIRRVAKPHLQAGLLESSNRELEDLNRTYADVLRDLRPVIEKELREQGDTNVTHMQHQETALRAEIDDQIFFLLDGQVRRLFVAGVPGLSELGCATCWSNPLTPNPSPPSTGERGARDPHPVLLPSSAHPQHLSPEAGPRKAC